MGKIYKRKQKEFIKDLIKARLKEKPPFSISLGEVGTEAKPKEEKLNELIDEKIVKGVDFEVVDVVEEWKEENPKPSYDDLDKQVQPSLYIEEKEKQKRWEEEVQGQHLVVRAKIEGSVDLEVLKERYIDLYEEMREVINNKGVKETIRFKESKIIIDDVDGIKHKEVDFSSSDKRTDLLEFMFKDTSGKWEAEELINNIKPDYLIETEKKELWRKVAYGPARYINKELKKEGLKRDLILMSGTQKGYRLNKGYNYIENEDSS